MKIKELFSKIPKKVYIPVFAGIAVITAAAVIITTTDLFGGPAESSHLSQEISSSEGSVPDSSDGSQADPSQADQSQDISGTTSVQDSDASSSPQTSASTDSSSNPTSVPEDDLKRISDIWVNVKDFGAKGDGSADDASAIESAINSIKDTGGAVYIPAGNYKMGKGVLVPMGVSVIGQTPSTLSKWQNISPDASPKANEASGSSWISASNFSGTWIMPVHGKGNVNSAPTFRLQGNTTVENLGFVYPQQPPVVSSVSQFPPAIAVITTRQYRYVRDGVRIANIKMLNPYVGIAIMQGQDFSDYQVGADDTSGYISTGRMTVHDITASPLWKGIFIKGILDTVDIQRASFALSNFNAVFARFRHNECRDIEVARADGINIADTYSVGASYGIKTTTAFSGSSSLRVNDILIKARIPVSVVTGMYKFNNADLIFMNYGNYCSSDTYRGIEVFQDYRCVHQPFYLFNDIVVRNGIVSSSVSDIAMHIKLGKSANVSVMDSEFIGADPGGSEPVVLLEKNDGSAVSAIFVSSTFRNSGSAGLLADMESVSEGSLQFNDCTIQDDLYNSLPSGNRIWFFSSSLISGTPISSTK